MPGDSRGASDHSGPCPGRRGQPLSYWTCKACLSVWVGRVSGRLHTSLAIALCPRQISSALRARRLDSYLQRFLSLQQSFLCCAFVIVLGGGCFLLTALYLERDKAQAQAQTQQPDRGTPVPCTHAELRTEHLGAGSNGPSLALGWLVCLFVFIQKCSLHSCYMPKQACRCWGVTKLGQV